MNESGDPMDVVASRGPYSDSGRTHADGLVDPRARVPSGEAVFEVSDLAVYYGAFRAVRDVNLTVRKNEITAFIGPSGCGKSTVLRCFDRMNDLIESARVEGNDPVPRRRPVRTERRRRRGATSDRHGLPEAEPVSEIDLRQSRVRPAPERHQEARRTRRHRRIVAPSGGAVGRGEGPARRVRRWVCRAGSSSGSASRGASPSARRDPDGRAVLRARPDRDRPHRGPDEERSKRTTRS